PRTVDIHQRDLAAQLPGDAQDVVDQARRETRARAEQRELDRSAEATGQTDGVGILGMRGVTGEFLGGAGAGGVSRSGFHGESSLSKTTEGAFAQAGIVDR